VWKCRIARFVLPPYLNGQAQSHKGVGRGWGLWGGQRPCAELLMPLPAWPGVRLAVCRWRTAPPTTWGYRQRPCGLTTR
jgi:hypothetical protein